MQATRATCLVIEDSVPGVQAAVAAGIPVIGFTGGAHCRPGHAERLLAAGAIAVAYAMSQAPGLSAIAAVYSVDDQRLRFGRWLAERADEPLKPTSTTQFCKRGH